MGEDAKSSGDNGNRDREEGSTTASSQRLEKRGSSSFTRINA